jgi:2-deoxy-D-gluconate 3-dehydrogenase
LANKGIGAACAIALAQAGASICLVQRQPKNAAEENLETYNTIRAGGGAAYVVHCDLNDIDSVHGVFQTALETMGGQIHILVNCAGIQRRSPSVDFPTRDWDDVRTRLTQKPPLIHRFCPSLQTI